MYNPWCTYSPLVPKRDTFMLEMVQPCLSKSRHLIVDNYRHGHPIPDSHSTMRVRNGEPMCNNHHSSPYRKFMLTYRKGKQK